MEPGLYRDVKSCEETQNFLSLKSQMLINRLKHDLGDVKSGKSFFFFLVNYFALVRTSIKKKRDIFLNVNDYKNILNKYIFICCKYD